MDHIIALAKGHDYAEDWYGLHVQLTRQFGPRVNEETGETRWIWSADPFVGYRQNPDSTRFVMVRTFAEEVEEIAKGIAMKSVAQHQPEVGETVSFALVCSPRLGRPSTLRAIKKRKESFEQFGRGPITANFPGNTGPQMETIEMLIARAGLRQVNDFENFAERRYVIKKGRRHENRGVIIMGIFASGLAQVEDKEALDAALMGLGRDRAFGFGLLTINPANREKVAA